MQEGPRALRAPLDELLPRCATLRHLCITVPSTIDVARDLARVRDRCTALIDAQPGKVITFANQRDG